MDNPFWLDPHYVFPSLGILQALKNEGEIFKNEMKHQSDRMFREKFLKNAHNELQIGADYDIEKPNKAEDQC